jgi:LCP family protein required for cell wall assembly
MFVRATAVVILLFSILLPISASVAQTASPNDPPPAMPRLEAPGEPVVILLMGADTAVQTNSGRTDVLMLAAIDTQAGTVSLLSIPRDLYVLLPDERMGRINTAYGIGALQAGNTGPDALIDTIRYNLGIDVDYWARVDFADFRQLIDDIGGVELVVDCAIQDWRLREPALDPALEENWEQYTLPVGVHTMHGDLALWYARSRRTSSDFDRGRRQQALLQGIWQRVRQLGLDTQIAEVWPQLIELVDTNMTVDAVLDLLPVALALEPSQLAHFTLHNGHEVRSWQSPEGSSVLAPEREALRATLEQFLTPPTSNQLRTNPVRVEVINATGIRGMDRVASWRLAWEGIVTTIAEPAPRALGYTQLIDLSGQAKASPGELVMQALNLRAGALTVEPDPGRSSDFRLIIGQDYFPCTYSVLIPVTSP